VTNKKEFNDLDILEEIKQKLYNKILNDKSQPKVGDLLKVIEMKNKLSVAGRGEKKFWEMIDKIRREELSSAEGTKARKSKRAGATGKQKGS
jgi:hypothetical protein